MAGFSFLWEYESTPGIDASPEIEWPAASGVSRESTGYTLVIFAHPRCPCTRASIEELARVMSRCRMGLKARVLFYKPADVSLEWSSTNLWHTAKAIPGVTAQFDRDGAEAQLFDAATSGAAYLFDSQGRLMFSGGLTGSRGHAGANIGSDAIVEIVNTGRAEHRRTHVFGCALFSDESPGGQSPVNETGSAL